MSIATKTGDDGSTGMMFNRRVPKTHSQVEAYGSVDELNAALGLALSLIGGAHAEAEAMLLRIQADLFELGAELADPAGRPRTQAARVAELEAEIDRLTERLAPLKNFILPGGSPKAAALHLARTICRRAERSVVALAREAAVSPAIVKYLNRLSDLLFVLARAANAQAGRPDIKW